MTLRDLDAIVQALYETALVPHRLPLILREIADLCQGRAAALVVRDARTGTLPVNVMTGLPDGEDRVFERDYAFAAGADPWTMAQDVVSTDWFRDRLAPAGMTDAVAVAVDDPEVAVLLIILRDDGMTFGGGDRRRLDLLRPHLPHVARLLGRVADMESRAAATTALLDALDEALVVIDDQRRVVYANAAAEELLARDPHLEITEGTLRLVSQRHDERFGVQVERAARQALVPETSAGAGEALAVPRDPGLRPLGVVVHPLPVSGGSLGADRPLVAVHLSDPDTARAPSEGVLGGLFALTPAEARLLRALIRDVRLDDYAAERGVSVTTARTQLARLFRKTGTGRQPELVRLAVTAGGPFRE